MNNKVSLPHLRLTSSGMSNGGKNGAIDSSQAPRGTCATSSKFWVFLSNFLHAPEGQAGGGGKGEGGGSDVKRLKAIWRTCADETVVLTRVVMNVTGPGAPRGFKRNDLNLRADVGDLRPTSDSRALPRDTSK